MKANQIVHRETILLKGAPETISKFIKTPERILDYYPNPISGGMLGLEGAFYCQGKSGISLLEQVEAAATTAPKDAQIITLRVSTARPFRGDITRDKIAQNLFFIMYEDWILSPHAEGTLLTKVWRNIDKKRMKFLPLKMIVRLSAKKESTILTKAWNKAAGFN